MSEVLSSQEAIPRIRSVLSKGNPCRIVVTGNSMRPLLRNRKDAVILSPVVSPVRRGDILFYLRSGNNCVLHQVQKIGPDDCLYMCGAAQWALEPIKREAVIGRVSVVERGRKLIDCHSLCWRFVAFFWTMLHPIRPYFIRAWRRLHR